MATSLVSTGLQFPDSTIQTTAATAGGGSIEAVASGSLANGDLVVINTDGTVSVVSETTVATSSGTPVLFSATGQNTQSIASAYDAANNKVIVAFTYGSDDYGRVCVGTVSGASISFGAITVFKSGACAELSVSVIPGQCFAIMYRDYSASSIGNSVGCSISGTTVTVGSEYTFYSSGQVSYVRSVYDPVAARLVVVFRSSATNYGYCRVASVSGTTLTWQASTPAFKSTNVDYMAVVYHPPSGNIVIAYRNNTDVEGQAIVGTVSSTSVSFGSAYVYNSGSTPYNAITYDSTSQSVIIAFRDEGNANYGTAIAGSISGDVITYGSKTVFKSATTNQPITALYDSARQKVVFSYATSTLYQITTGSVSGTSITIDASTYDVVPTGTSYVGAAYDSTNEKIVYSYRNNSNNDGYATVVSIGYTSTNLTSENYIGISNGAYSDAATATIQVAGAVDDAQTGLTPGQSYYVQPDGTLSTTAGTPSVFAGTAVASTKIIVKG